MLSMNRTIFCELIILILTLIPLDKCFCQATNKIDTIGSVGIGITNPATLLHVQSSEGGSLLRLSKDSNNFLYSGLDEGGAFIESVANSDNRKRLRIQSSTNDGGGGDYTQLFIDGANRRIFTNLGTKVGIGVSQPQAFLHVESRNTGNIVKFSSDDSNYWISGVDDGGTYIESVGQTALKKRIRIQTSTTDGNNAVYTQLFIDGANQVIHTGGNVRVGIGTPSPTEKLSVNGNIWSAGYVKSKKIIATQLGWSDYVFADDYKLRPLSEVSYFIKKYKHLPEVPSAKEVAENGVDIGDSQALLLKKIEELTLYLIEMKNNEQQLQKRVADLEKGCVISINKKQEK